MNCCIFKVFYFELFDWKVSQKASDSWFSRRSSFVSSSSVGDFTLKSIVSWNGSWFPLFFGQLSKGSDWSKRPGSWMSGENRKTSSWDKSVSIKDWLIYKMFGSKKKFKISPNNPATCEFSSILEVSTENGSFSWFEIEKFLCNTKVESLSDDESVS